MQRNFQVLFLLLFLSASVISQEKDSVRRIPEVLIRAYLSEQPLLSTPASVSVVSSEQLGNHSGTSLLPAINTVAGLRMEERSPGSYRLSIRGSLLRSPFGVRNVKFYMDEFPLTDAGGNTYLNSLDMGGIHQIEVLKGPDGSLFGANSGGVVILNPFDRTLNQDHVSISTTAGSYGLFQEKVNAGTRWKRNALDVSHAYQESQGYREHSAMKRNFNQLSYRHSYRERDVLKVLAFYSDLDYKTPGGLTRAQYDADPSAARPSSATVPGPVVQRARIGNKTFYAGLSNERHFTSKLKHVIALYGSLTDFRNPFISNYEVRDEQTAGLRTWVELKGGGPNINWNWNTGAELQSTLVDFSNYDNNAGTRGALQAQDDIRATQGFYFSRYAVSIHRFHAELALSYNRFRYDFSKDEPSAGSFRRKFDPEFMPRLAVSYEISPRTVGRATISRGYSTPTSAEVRASDNIINTALEYETGWNYEAGLRFSDIRSRFWLDLSAFSYKLSNAIVRRVNADDTEFYLNAGGTDQKGVEAEMSYWLLEPGTAGFLNGIRIQSSYTYSHYRFGNYQSGSIIYTGNRLTGSPESVLVSGLTLRLGNDISLFAQHNFTSRIPLNDANSVYSDKFDLVQLKGNWKIRLNGNKTDHRLEVFAGIDNLLDETYSLGNDLNAFGGRFFNAAPGRNYFLGIRAAFIR